jgi:hypothetical protein
MPKSKKLWIMAVKQELGDKKKKAVLLRALEEIPDDL